MYRILAICGGGVWGIGVAAVLAALAKIGFDINHLFKGYAGTSVGAIIAALLAYGYSAKEVYKIFQTETKTMFTKTSWWARYLKVNSPRYQTKFVKQVMDKYFPAGTRLCDLPKPLYIVAWRNNGDNRNKVFCPEDETLVRDAVMASMSAPWYFDALEVDGEEYSDGGLWQNNPALILLIETLHDLKVSKHNDLSDVGVLTFVTSGNSRGRKIKGKNWLTVFKYLIGQLISGRASGTDYMVRKLGAISGAKTLTLMPHLTRDQQDIGLDDVDKLKEIEKIWMKHYYNNETAILSWLAD